MSIQAVVLMTKSVGEGKHRKSGWFTIATQKPLQKERSTGDLSPNWTTTNGWMLQLFVLMRLVSQVISYSPHFEGRNFTGVLH
jgi:hypothetical protein